MLALAAAAPALLLVARLLPADGVGLAVRLFAATVCVLVLPGALILRAFAWPDSPSLALTAAVMLSLAVAFGSFLLTFATAGTLTLALVLMGIAALVALVPAALARVGSDEPGERLAFAVLIVAALAYGAVVWWVSHSLGTGDVLFHLARARKIADGETLDSLRVVGEFRDGGLHPGYAFPLWHGVVAMIARLAGVDVSLVVLHGAAMIVPLAFAAAYSAGRALFGSWVGGVSVLSAQVAQIGFTHAGTGSFPSIAPGSVTRVVLVPALLALLFAYLREREWRLLVPLGAASLAVVVIHSSYIVLIAVPIAGFALLLVALWNPRREAAIGLAASLGVVAVTAGLFLAWLQPTVASTASFQPEAREKQRAIAHYGDQLQVSGDTYRAAPAAITFAGPVVVAALILLPVAALGARRRWGAYAAGGMLACLAVLLIPQLFTLLSDLVSISQSRRLTQFMPVPFVIAAAAVVVGRARLAGVVMAFGGALALEVLYSSDTPGPVWPFWLGILGALAGIAVAVLRPIRLEVTRWAAFATLAFVVPFMVAGLGSLDRQDEPDPYALTAGVVAVLRDLDDNDVVLAPIQTSYRVAAFAPVYVAAMPQSHVADTEENQSRERQRDVIRFFARGKLDEAERQATLERWGAGWLLVDKSAPRPDDLAAGLEPVYEDGRYALYRVDGT